MRSTFTKRGVANVFRPLLYLSLPFTLFALWWLLTDLNLVHSLYLPRLFMVKNSLLYFLGVDGILDIVFTILRTLASFCIASAIGISAGLAIGMSKRLYVFFEVLIDFFRSFPSTALLPLFLFIFGLGETTKIALASFVSMWIILIHSIYGVWNIPPLRVKVARVFRASRRQLLMHVIFHSALPEIFVGLRIAFSICLIMVIISEMMVGTKYGIGKEIYESYLSYRIDQLYASLIVAGLIGYLFNKSFLLTERRAIHWAGR